MPDTLNAACLINHTAARSPAPPAATAGTEAAIARADEAEDPAAGPVVFHTVGEVARTLGVSPKTVGRRIRDGFIRKVAMGGRLVRISSTELRRLAADAPFKRARCTVKYQYLSNF